MEPINSFNILSSSEENLEFELTSQKRENRSPYMRANVFLSFAVLGMSLTQVDAASNYNFRNFDYIHNVSLRCTEEISNQISHYSNGLTEKSFIDKSQFIEKIIAFRSLENSWDGFGAIPTGVKCASNAIKMVDALDTISLEKISDIYPNPNGTITFEIENEYDEIISLEIGKDTFTYFVDFNSFETKFFNKQNFSFENIEILKKFISAI